MKKLILISMVLVIALSAMSQNSSLRKVDNFSFNRGETLKFRVFYDSWLINMSAGEATVQVTNTNLKFAGRNTFHIVMTGQSSGLFSKVMYLNDRYETYIDEETLAPWLFIRSVIEGKYRASQNATFNQFNNQVNYKNNIAKTSTILNVPKYTHDILSAFYYARNLDVTNLKVNDMIAVDFVIDDTLYTSKIIYKGKYTVDTHLGKIKCLMFKPMLATGNVFQDPYPMELYVTDDKNHLPVLIKSGVFVGSVKVELISYDGIANPFTAMVKESKAHAKMVADKKK